MADEYQEMQDETVFFSLDRSRRFSGLLARAPPGPQSVALSRYEKMCVLHVRKKLSRLQLGSQSDEYG